MLLNNFLIVIKSKLSRALTWCTNILVLLLWKKYFKIYTNLKCWYSRWFWWLIRKIIYSNQAVFVTKTFVDFSTYSRLVLKLNSPYYHSSPCSWIIAVNDCIRNTYRDNGWFRNQQFRSAALAGLVFNICTGCNYSYNWTLPFC